MVGDMGCSEVLGDTGSVFYMRVSYKVLFWGEYMCSINANKNLTQWDQSTDRLPGQKQVRDKTGNVGWGPKREGP